jgi:hypothetical protein
VWATQGVVGGLVFDLRSPFDIKGPDESAIVDAERILYRRCYGNRI